MRVDRVPWQAQPGELSHAGPSVLLPHWLFPSQDQGRWQGFIDEVRISDEALQSLEKDPKADRKINIVTFDSMQRLNDYRDTGLYVYLVRTENGAVIGGNIDDPIASAIVTDIYEVPRKYREKALSNTQAIIYRKKEIAYIDVERS